jgi:tetratricopeptide (TPR) repeat protein
LSELGEHEKAERVLAKARALSERPSWTAVSEDEEAPAPDEDLIAFAERRERKTQSALSPKHLALGVAALAFLGLTVAGIASVTSGPEDALGPAEPTEPVAAARPMVLEQDTTTTALEIETAVEESAAEPILPVPVRESAELEPAPPPPIVPSTETAAAIERPEPSAPRKAAPAKPRKPNPPPRNPEPSASVVQTELASMNPRELTSRADALYARGHSGLAATYYRRALELDPDYAPALVGIGRNTLRAKKYSEAMRNATRALELARGVDARPGLEAAALYQMGRVHFEQGERDSARRLFKQSISLPGTPPQAWFYLGEALSSDNSPAAREAYEQYLELVPQGHLADRARRAIQ